MKSLFFIITLVISSLVSADERRQSVMFSDPAGDKSYLTNAPDTDKSKGEYCMEMSRKIESLKGKPQRRHAMLERYRAECGVK